MSIERKSAAIMFTDIAGYTEAMSESEQKALEMLRKKRSIIKPFIDNHKGTYVKELCLDNNDKEIREFEIELRKTMKSYIIWITFICYIYIKKRYLDAAYQQLNRKLALVELLDNSLLLKSPIHKAIVEEWEKVK